jgi:heme-degrading monooxygenase HmoA
LPSICVAVIEQKANVLPMLTLVFSYEARDAVEFERAYGPDGEWTAFFRSGRGYVGTELLRDVETPGRYLVIDRWESPDAYNTFVAANRDEYVRRVDDTRYLYDQELRFGTFENVWARENPEPGE